jgi:hypothetical protein
MAFIAENRVNDIENPLVSIRRIIEKTADIILKSMPPSVVSAVRLWYTFCRMNPKASKITDNITSK